ncbi:hypothetical protein G9A89_015713 [Geosiphon pyriformis]|nr:hypothetical protein G9A89_015713 [Geosiphon pyriformis]
MVNSHNNFISLWSLFNFKLRNKNKRLHEERNIFFIILFSLSILTHTLVVVESVPLISNKFDSIAQFENPSINNNELAFVNDPLNLSEPIGSSIIPESENTPLNGEFNMANNFDSPSSTTIASTFIDGGEFPNTNSAQDQIASNPFLTQDQIPSDSFSTQGQIPSDSFSTQGQISSGLFSTQGQIASNTLSTQDQVPSDSFSTQDQIPSDTLTTQDQIPSDTSSTENQVASDTSSTQDQIPSDTSSTENQVASDTSSTQDQIASDTSSIQGNTANLIETQDSLSNQESNQFSTQTINEGVFQAPKTSNPPSVAFLNNEASDNQSNSFEVATASTDDFLQDTGLVKNKPGSAQNSLSAKPSESEISIPVKSPVPLSPENGGNSDPTTSTETQPNDNSSTAPEPTNTLPSSNSSKDNGESFAHRLMSEWETNQKPPSIYTQNIIKSWNRNSGESISSGSNRESTQNPPNSEQQSIQVQVPPQESSQQQVPPQESSQQQVPPQESSQQQVPPQESSQQQVPPQESSQQQVPPQESSQQQVPTQTDQTTSGNMRPLTGDVLKGFKTYASLANLAYCTDLPLEKGMMKFGDGDGVSGFVYVNQKAHNVIFGFKGPTSPNDEKLIDKSSLEPYKDGGQVHAGWYNTYSSAEPGLIPKMVEFINPFLQTSLPFKLFFTGHDSGGAYAVFTALALQKKFSLKKVSVLTFGQPRLGDAQFAQLVNSRLVVYRITVGNDIVSNTPSRDNGYIHFQNEVWYNKGSAYVCRAPNGQENQSCNQGQKPLSSELHDGRYFEVMMNHCPRPRVNSIPGFSRAQVA